jgi:methylaspartate mutase epsilon subunit
MNNKAYSILLGGIGGDCHCVGATILRHALQAAGYRVHYLGTQNALEDFFKLCPFFNVVMISSMDGHSRYYLADFSERYRASVGERPLWYLGGNLSIGDGARIVRHFVEMGFDRAFATFIDIAAVLEYLAQDLEPRHVKSGLAAVEPRSMDVDVRGGPLSDDTLEHEEFERRRAEVLGQWKTGSAARNLGDNAQFLLRQPSFPAAQAAANRRQSILLQPRCGVAMLDQQIDYFRTLRSAGADVLSYQVDSLTRLNDYAGADRAIRESRTSKVPLLNGFPVVSHGVPGLQCVLGHVRVPLQTRHSTRDPALLAEISYGGGVTAFEGGAICYNLPYYKDYPIAESIRRWQYVDRLTGHYYSEFGIVLDREYFGVLTGTLIPPSIAIVCDLLESLLSVQQGVKCLSLGYAEQGNRIQDIAAIRTMRAMAGELLFSLGYKGIQINTVFHQYMAAFPNDRDLGAQLVYNSAVTAALSGATRILIKTPVEAFYVPGLKDNVEALQLVRAGTLAAQSIVIDEPAVARECEIIRREVWAMLDSVMAAGSGILTRGIVNAFRLGYVDIPFAPSIHNRGAVLTARDVDGAVRFLSVGNLQFDAELRDFHSHKADERRHAEGLQKATHDYRLVERDVMQIARGDYPSWPLSEQLRHPHIFADVRLAEPCAAPGLVARSASEPVRRST